MMEQVAMVPGERTQRVVERAKAIGFDLCGVARPDALAELEHLPEWLTRGYGGEMEYLRDPRRLDPQRALEGARSLIIVALNYNTGLTYSIETMSAREDEPHGWISRYAWGDDYHEILGEKLETLLTALHELFPEPFAARAYVDTGPVVERVAAKYAGLGWLAKNTCLINEKLGSWLFLGVILTTLELEPTLGPGEPPPADLCGNCRLCIDACPTGAIVEPYLLDARRCISYLTIELRGTIPEEFRPAMGRMVFGCDICQDVCPWNRKAPESGLAEFLPRKIPQKTEIRGPDRRDESGGKLEKENSLYAPSLEWLASLTESDFREIFRGSAVKRAKWRGLLRNTCVALGNSRLPPDLETSERFHETLKRLAASPDTLIAEHARWALARLQRDTD